MPRWSFVHLSLRIGKQTQTSQLRQPPSLVPRPLLNSFCIDIVTVTVWNILLEMFGHMLVSQPRRRKMDAHCSTSCLITTLTWITWITLPSRWKPALPAWLTGGTRRIGIGPTTLMPLSNSRILLRLWWSTAIAIVDLTSPPPQQCSQAQWSVWSCPCRKTWKTLQAVQHCLLISSTT